MKSHLYTFTGKDAVEIALRPLLVVLFAAVALHLAEALRFLPPPRPLLDVDRTIVLHQIDATRRPQDAQLLFIGDSSCLMDVDTMVVTKDLGLPALNLGTLSFLDLTHYARLLENYFRHNPSKVRAVVLLCHPEALRRHGPDPYYAGFFESALANEDFRPPVESGQYIPRLLGLHLLKERLQPRLLPTPLPKEFGQYYGFAPDLYHFMDTHRGAAVEPGLKVYEGDGRYYLTSHQEKVSRAFKKSLPPGIKLIIGMTPSPQSFIENAYPHSLEGMLDQWKKWLQADAALTELPISVPDRFCASVTHLTPAGRAAYTDALVDQLRQILPPSGPAAERASTEGEE